MTLAWLGIVVAEHHQSHIVGYTGNLRCSGDIVFPPKVDDNSNYANDFLSTCGPPYHLFPSPVILPDYQYLPFC